MDNWLGFSSDTTKGNQERCDVYRKKNLIRKLIIESPLPFWWIHSNIDSFMIVPKKEWAAVSK